MYTWLHLPHLTQPLAMCSWSGTIRKEVPQWGQWETNRIVLPIVGQQRVCPGRWMRGSGAGVLGRGSRHEDPAVFAVCHLQGHVGRVGLLELLGLAFQNAGQH